MMKNKGAERIYKDQGIFIFRVRESSNPAPLPPKMAPCETRTTHCCVCAGHGRALVRACPANRHAHPHLVFLYDRFFRSLRSRRPRDSTSSLT